VSSSCPPYDLRDQNDNSPQFDGERLEVHIPEDIKVRSPHTEEHNICITLITWDTLKEAAQKQSTSGQIDFILVNGTPDRTEALK
jgi:hypothetical protein